jgi:hypothetical protein
MVIATWGMSRIGGYRHVGEVINPGYRKDKETPHELQNQGDLVKAG